MIEPSLNKLMEADLNIKTAYRLSKLLKKVGGELQTLEETRVRLVKKFADNPDAPEGQEIKVKETLVNKFNEEFNVLLNEEIDIPFDPIPLDEIGDGVKLTPIDVIRLGKIIFDKDDDDPEVVEPMVLPDPPGENKAAEEADTTSK